MRVEQVAKMPVIKRFLYWIKERHSIYLKRLEGESKPWTNDAVLQSYFFTNPYRENDKTTVWFRNNIRNQLQNEPSVLFSTICFRWFNYIPTGELLLKHYLTTKWGQAKAVRVLQQLTGLRKKVFTGAFMIMGAPGEDKVVTVCRRINAVWHDRHNLVNDAATWGTLYDAHERLMQYEGLGGFMAYEIVCDLRYTQWLHLATDKDTWCNPGPGARRGLNRIMGVPDSMLNHAIPQRVWNKETAKLLKKVNRLGLPKMEMREVEHSLCEFDKYERARTGQGGRIKRTYNGR